MQYGTPAFAAVVCDAFDYELARSGNRANALGAAVGAAIATGVRWDPDAMLEATRRALGARLHAPMTDADEAAYLAQRRLAGRRIRRAG